MQRTYLWEWQFGIHVGLYSYKTNGQPDNVTDPQSFRKTSYYNYKTLNQFKRESVDDLT